MNLINILKLGLNRNILVYDSKANDFSERLISLMKECLISNSDGENRTHNMVFYLDNSLNSYYYLKGMTGVNVQYVDMSIYNAIFEDDGATHPKGKKNLVILQDLNSTDQSTSILLGSY